MKKKNRLSAFGCRTVTCAISRKTRASLLSLVVLVSGCAARQGSANDAGQVLSDDSRSAVDETRKHLTLSEIEPAIEPPKTSEPIKPVSARAARQIEAARRLVEQQRYTEATIELERALRYDPDHPEIQRALATLHWQAGNMERARIHAALALEADPDNATAHYVIGRYAASGGDHVGAITAYRTALLCSDFGEDTEIAAACHYHLAQSLDVEGYLEAALAQYAAFERRATDPNAGDAQDALVDLLQSKRRELADARSKILERLGRYAEAAEAFAPLLTDTSDVARALHCARLWLRAGRIEDALRVAGAIRADSDEVIELLFEIHEKAGHPERIVDDLRARLADRPDEPRLALNLGEALIRLGRSQDAGSELRRFLEHHPDAEAVRMRLIDLLLAESSWDEALSVCSEGIKRQPARASAFEARIVALSTDEGAVDELLGPRAGGAVGAPIPVYLRGILAAAAERFDQAERLLKTSHAADPTFVPARVALAKLYLEDYRYSEALKIAARADADLPEDARLEKTLGEIHERLDDLDQAELHLKAAVQLNRTDSEAMLSLAKVLQSSGKVNRAQLQLRVLLDQDPGHEEAREMLAYSYLREGKKDPAVEQFEELRKLATTASTRARCDAWLARRHDSDPQAFRDALNAAADADPNDITTRLILAQDYIGFEQDQARDAYLEALAIDPKNEEALTGLVGAEERLLEFESAIEHLKQLLPRRPNRHSWRRELIDLYTVVQDHETALAMAQKEAARDDLNDAERAAYRSALLRSLRNLDRQDEVLRQLEAWAGADPEDIDVKTRLADEYINQDQASKAVPVIEELYQKNVSDRAKLAQLINALVAAGQHERASQYALDWVYDDPEGDLALSVLVTVLAEAERVDDALELINSKLLRSENREHFQDLAGGVLQEAERYDDAIQLTEDLIGEVGTLMRRITEDAPNRLTERPDNERLIRRPNEPFSPDTLNERLHELQFRLAQELGLAKRYREAEELLIEWLSAPEPRRRRVDFAYMRILAFCQQAQGHDEQAARTSEHALMLEDDDIGLNNDVAYGWIDRGVRLEEAEVRIRYALSRNPTESAYLDTYGWLLYKKGAFEDARKWLLRAAGTRGPTDAVILDHLGDACWRLGQSEEAVKHWAAAVELLTADEDEDRTLSSDERRVLETTQGKIDAARGGEAPSVAPLAGPSEEEDGEQGDAP